MTAHSALDPNAPILGQIRATVGTVVDGSADDLTPPVKMGGVDGSGNVQTALVGPDGTQAAGGNLASGVADSGNPVKVGGKYNATSPALTDGWRSDLQLDVRGNVKMTLGNGTTFAGVSATPTGQDANGALTALAVVNEGLLFNGTNWDRQRGNQDNITAGITAAGVTTTQTGADQTNYNARGVIVVLDMTTVGTGSVTLEIDGKDPVSGKYYALLTGAAVVTNVTNTYTVYPGNTVATNVSASTVLPRTWRVKVTANNANATTYTVGASLIL